LINIQLSSILQGGIPFERLCGKTPDYSSLYLFGCVCYVLLAPHEHTKLTAQSTECVFLGYSVENKGYRYWDPVACRMRTSRDVVFDESHPFYPCPTTDSPPASLIDPLSFLFFSDAPMPLPLLTLPTSVSSAESSPVLLLRISLISFLLFGASLTLLALSYPLPPVRLVEIRQLHLSFVGPMTF
jgi:hypothetical protein